ncbi:sensor histidine kinase [Terrimonas sp. NA20]|uniref:Sensor histidine kinase n=1 Tax=Terrimonas ginsenosidimutans TaxID=2908004 RepID=A0ABS9L0Z4_9BACT|nr:sensor histidine kinase [Terrimonas ginsenosidimutans]MCG2618178.1 sensor histidine kinase [Terrimonas ginsenosidimutans]
MPLIERIVYFSSRHRVLSHILFWLVVSIIFLNRYTIEEYQEIDKIIYRHCYYMSFMMVASYFVAYLIIPKLLSAKNYYLIAFYALFGSYLICVCSRLAVVYILEPLIRQPPFGQESLWEIMTDLPKLFLHYFAQAFSTAWLFAFIKLIKGQYLIQQRSLRLEKEQAQAELKALKAQLNPHFLFNTLNNIYSLSLMNSPITSRSIAGLSEILDHVLYRCNSASVPLAAEIKLIENYLELEKLRYSDRLRLTFVHQIDEDLDIAPLLLLSLVENAFKHGAGENIGTPFIAIRLALQEGEFHFSVINSFVPDSKISEDNRIGLNNIRKQLQLIYGNGHDLVVLEKDDCFVVELYINLRKDFKRNYNNESKVSHS